MYGFRMSDGFLESLCSRIFMSQEFREDLKAVGYDLEDYVYKDERLFPSRVYDEYKACFELFDYIMDGQLFDFSCKKYETNEEMIADINRYRLNTIFEYLDKSNDALWKLKKFEGKESSEEFQSLLEEYKDKTLGFFSKLYDPHDLARFYRNLGYYYIEREEWELAKAIYIYSMRFDNSDKAKNELIYIIQKSNSQELPNPEKVKSMLEKYYIPTKISERNLKIIEEMLNAIIRDKQQESGLGQYLKGIDDFYRSL